MMHVTWPRLLALGCLALLLAALVSARAAANAVPSSSIVQVSFTIGPNDLKPPECTGLALTTLITGNTSISGTAGNDLILGSAAADTAASIRPSAACRWSIVGCSGSSSLSSSRGSGRSLAFNGHTL